MAIIEGTVGGVASRDEHMSMLNEYKNCVEYLRLLVGLYIYYLLRRIQNAQGHNMDIKIVIKEPWWHVTCTLYVYIVVGNGNKRI